MKIRNRILCTISMLAAFACFSSAIADLQTGLVHSYYFNGPVNIEFMGDSLGSETIIVDEFAEGDVPDDDPDMGIIPFDITDPNTYFVAGNFVHKTTDRDGEDGFSLNAGKFNNAIYYDGSRRDGDNEIEAPIPGIAGAEQFTMSLWFKPNAAVSDTWACLLSRSNSSNSAGFLTGVETNPTYAGRINWSNRICGANFTAPAASAENAQYDPIYYRDGQWNLLVITWDHSAGNAVDALNIWVNGNNVKDYLPASSMVTYGTFETPGEDWVYKLGADRRIWDRWYAGEMDEMNFWNRALSESEVSKLWNGGGGKSFEDLPGRAGNPTPADFATDVDPASTTTLTWDYFDDGTIQSVDSYAVSVTSVRTADLALGEPNIYDITPVTVTAGSMPITIPNDVDYTYIWKVDTTYTDTNSASRTVLGDVWTFETTGLNSIPELDLPAVIVTSLDFMPATIIPTTFVNDDTQTFAWTLTPETEGMAVVDTSVGNSPSAELQGDVVGTYTVTLTVTDGANQTVSDSVIVKVAETPCAASQLLSTWGGFNTYDINQDCKVNFDDLTDLIVEWLDDVNIVEPVVE